MKIQAGLFQPVGRIGAVFSAESLFGRQIDENGCVGQIISERGGVDLPDECFGQSPAAGLISDGRIDIAVADDELSGPERGFHAVVEMLDARGGTLGRRSGTATRLTGDFASVTCVRARDMC